MSVRLAAALLLALAALGSACGSGGGLRGEAREVTEALAETRVESRQYRYTDASLDGETVYTVDGKVHDDLRYSGTVSRNGRPLFQQIVSDDSVALRIRDPEALAEVLQVAERRDPITARALREGRWVVDHTVAPPLLAAAVAEEDRTADQPTLGSRRAVGDDPFIDAAQVVNYVDRAVRSGFRLARFNAEDIDYNALDDPWRDDEESALEDAGIRRYDLELPALPPPAGRGQQQALPGAVHFRKMAIYVKGERVVEVREQIAIADRREFRRAEGGQAAQYYLRLRDDALGGAVRDTLRERRMTYEVTSYGDVDVRLPDDVVEGFLGETLEALKASYGFEFFGGRGSGVPAIPGVTPASSPGASPAASPAADTEADE